MKLKGKQANIPKLTKKDSRVESPLITHDINLQIGIKQYLNNVHRYQE